jgi:cyanophycinase
VGSRTFLVGGGWEGRAAGAVHGPFLDAAGPSARIGCVIVDEGDGDEQFARYDGVLRTVADCRPVPLPVPLGERFEPGAALAEVDGLLVCGGLTPAYQEAFAGCREPLRRLLAERGIPYAGFSAGAALAAADAVVGGWLADGVPVCPADSAEDLEEVEVRPGLGLVPFAVDVHAAQWGTLGRLVAAVAGGRVGAGVALDENTVLEVPAPGGPALVGGLGRAHVVRPSADGGAVVRSYGAGETFSTV